MCESLTEGDVAKTFKATKAHDAGAEKLEGNLGAKHTILIEEQVIHSHTNNGSIELLNCTILLLQSWYSCLY